MGVFSHITDKLTKMSAEVVLNHKTDKQGLVVATFPLRSFENAPVFFTDQDGNPNLNIDASAGGTPEKVHDGTDSVLWTGSNIINNEADFSNTDQNHTSAGTQSVKLDNANINSVFQFAKGSSLDTTNYVSLTLWIWVDKDWRAGDNISMFGYDTALGTQIGDSVNLTNYFNYIDIDTWHKLTIPLDDFGQLSTIDALRVQIVAVDGKSPKFYIDDIQFEQTGNPVVYSIRPQKGQWLHVEGFKYSFADALDSTLTDGTMPNLSYDKILGETLVSGILFRRIQGDENRFSINLQSTIDILELYGSEITDYGSDGTNTFMTISTKFVEPLVLKHEDGDTLSFTVAEDLSGLLKFRISAGCKTEQKVDL